MAITADISRGMILKLDGSLYTVVDFGENKTARAAAKVWAKLKGENLEQWRKYFSYPCRKKGIPIFIQRRYRVQPDEQ